MKYKEFKEELDKYFDDDEEIFPHACGSCVMFCKIFHGQTGGLVETEFDGDRVPISFIDNSSNFSNR